MNYLQLCVSLRTESGISGSGPTAVTAQTGMYAKIVDWVQEAYAEILRMHPWSFLWARVSPVLTIGTSAYVGATFTPAISDLGRIYAGKMLDLTSTGTPRIYYRTWDQIDRLDATLTGPPRYFTRRPDDYIVFHPEPDAAYEVQIDYLKEGHALAANGDTPLIPDAQLHKIIVYKALTYYALHNEDQTAMAHGQRQFDMMLSQMFAKYGRPLMPSPAPLDVETNPNTLELV